MDPKHHEMKGNQYPFGELSEESALNKKILVLRKMPYRNRKEYLKIHETVEVLKKISHKNTINLRTESDRGDGHIDLFYPYVHISLEESFSYNSEQSVKELHKQFIELAIYLAKNYILTSFSPARCGIIIKEGESVIKYYLPTSEIIVTDNISMLERSVQLFTLQSMHYLDTLSQHHHNSTLSSNHSSQSFIQKTRLNHITTKLRKESQPVALNPKKFSDSKTKSQIRKLSTLSKEMSEFSQMHEKRKKESTKMSSHSKISFNKGDNCKSEANLSVVNESFNFVSQIEERIQKLRQRSRLALTRFGKLKDMLRSYRSLSPILQRIHRTVSASTFDS